MQENHPRSFRKTLLIPIIAIILLLFTTTLASASHNGPLITVTRLGGTMVGIKIEFSDPISGDFSGVINRNHFDCDTIPTNVLYCIGPLPHWVDGATLHIYGNPGGEVILTHLLSAPPNPGAEDPPPPPSNGECEGECIFID